MARLLRRGRLTLAVVSTFVVAGTGSALAAPYDDAGYWRFADRMQQRLDGLWSERHRYYEAGDGGVEPLVTANMLIVHSVAAQKGHEGPARQDHRARLIARRLLESPPFVATPPKGGPAGSQVHAPGFVNSMRNPRGNQHLVFDAEVVDGLVYAWKARQELDLPEETARLIQERLNAIARGSFWRYPTIRLNQVNWYSLVYAAAATVSGDNELLKRDMRLQLRRFFSGAARNLGPGMRFRYLPDSKLNHPMNVDSAEYANIALSFTRFYQQARSAGMAPLAPAHQRLAKAWISRAVTGYWTHGGYLNWDSGLGFDRWHQSKKLGLAQQALIGIAGAESLQPGPRYGAWAKYLLDRGFDFYDRISGDGIADGVLFGVRQVPQGIGSARLGAARMQGNAARAIAAGLGSKRAKQPPALYSFDPDIGRLAVTTPAYNTAIVAVNQRAFPYGGTELARLFDGDQNVAGGIGGVPPASFGVLVRDVGGRRILASQVGRASVSRASTPLRLTRAPRGAGVTASARVGRAFAGSFRDLRATGTTNSRTLQVRTTHRFTPRFIETRWTIRRLRGKGRYSADVLFPSTGSGARVVAVLRDGRRVPVGSLAKVAYLHVQSEDAGYVVKPITRPSGATAHKMRPGPQPSAPRPGPTLAIQLTRAARFDTASILVRVAPVRNADQAATLASHWGRDAR
jgi:hypothetical protein